MVRSDGFESNFGIVLLVRVNNPKVGLEAIRPHHEPLWTIINTARKPAETLPVKDELRESFAAEKY